MTAVPNQLGHLSRLWALRWFLLYARQWLLVSSPVSHGFAGIRSAYVPLQYICKWCLPICRFKACRLKIVCSHTSHGAAAEETDYLLGAIGTAESMNLRERHRETLSGGTIYLSRAKSFTIPLQAHLIWGDIKIMFSIASGRFWWSYGPTAAILPALETRNTLPMGPKLSQLRMGWGGRGWGYTSSHCRKISARPWRAGSSRPDRRAPPGNSSWPVWSTCAPLTCTSRESRCLIYDYTLIYDCGTPDAPLHLPKWLITNTSPLLSTLLFTSLLFSHPSHPSLSSSLSSSLPFLTPLIPPSSPFHFSLFLSFPSSSSPHLSLSPLPSPLSLPDYDICIHRAWRKEIM